MVRPSGRAVRDRQVREVRKLPHHELTDERDVGGGFVVVHRHPVTVARPEATPPSHFRGAANLVADPAVRGAT
ncbi:hypothetical protein GCM10027059_10120 [Myceligenerans halotolerans]